MGASESVQALLRDGFILVFNQDELDIVKTAAAVQQAGFVNMEVTCRIKQPVEKIEQLRRELPELVVGAASLIDSPDMLEVYNVLHADDPLPSVEQVVDAGVAYVVSAGNFRPETFGRYAGDIAIVPGCGTVSEIISQFALGANLVKIFPAKQLGGPGFVKAIDAPTHKIVPIVPTGGTTPENIPDYIAAGILVVGGSFSAIDKPTLAKIIDEQDYDLLAEQLKQIKQLMDNVRAAQWPSVDFATATPSDVTTATGRQFNLD
ncbi:MAG: bifunctional 4-hydroxy-2-oxoglutarate aldolase/2-dehydro-3-deoxy-phosphogluconate aldolase [Planctomycetota bacterium]|jgi:Entner-Doudoroff aldolase